MLTTHQQQLKPTLITVTAIITSFAAAIIVAAAIVLLILPILKLAIVAIPNENPMPPVPDHPIVQPAAGHYPTIGKLAPYSPPCCFSMRTRRSFCFSISWTFCVFRLRSFIGPALSAGGDHSAPGLCEWLVRCGRRRLAGQG